MGRIISFGRGSNQSIPTETLDNPAIMEAARKTTPGHQPGVRT